MVELNNKLENVEKVIVFKLLLLKFPPKLIKNLSKPFPYSFKDML